MQGKLFFDFVKCQLVGFSKIKLGLSSFGRGQRIDRVDIA